LKELESGILIDQFDEALAEEVVEPVLREQGVSVDIDTEVITPM
jgi:beta-lactamase superfamily II metal-dependent hydrolase